MLVLERGKAYPPGSFPRSPIGFKNNLWDPSEGLQGLFDLWSFSGLDALISSGLGGGSLIYANVLLRKDEKWFVSPERPGPGGEAWPITRADLDPHYDRAEKMLAPQRYPLEHAPYSRTPKTLAFKAAAEERNMDWFRPPLAVTFGNPGEDPVPGEPIKEERPNIHGRTRQTCRLVGECDVGCNYGAKNTLDYNYLTAAWHDGAEIRTRCEVREFEPREGGGWTVHYIEHTDEHEGQQHGHERASSGHRDGGRPGARGRNARKHVPAPEKPRRPSGALVAARRGLHRQRRPAHVRHPLRHDRDGRLARAAPDRPRLRTRDHERGADPRRARRGWRHGSRPLHRGRRLPRVRVLDAPDGGRAERPAQGRSGAGAPRAHAPRSRQREHQRRACPSCSAIARCPPAACRC